MSAQGSSLKFSAPVLKEVICVAGSSLVCDISGSMSYSSLLTLV